MQTVRVTEPGVILFIPESILPQPEPPPGPGPGTAPLPLSRLTDGWPTWIAGVHTDGQRNWYWLFKQADPSQNKPVLYKRQYPPPAPPEPPPEKLNPDGYSLWTPKDNQSQVSCQFDPIPYS
jgi:hypothetical protein